MILMRAMTESIIMSDSVASSSLGGVVGGEDVGVQVSSAEEDCSDGISLLVLSSELLNDL